MKKIITLGAVSLVASAVLIGCGSSSSDTTTDIETGYFIDAPVAGLSYKSTSGLSGVTDSAGKFQYKKGEKVRFSLGKLDFGEAAPTTEGLVSPRELTQNEEQVTLMLRTLQALDSDNNASNGIIIPASIVTALEGLSSDVALSDLEKESDILDLDVDLAGLLDEDFDGVIDVNDEDAKAHFEESMSAWNGGVKPESGTGTGTGHGTGTGTGTGHGTGTGTVFDSSLYPESNLTQEVVDSLAYMGNEERLAYDVYTVLYNYHNGRGTEIKQLQNIPKAERSHVGIVQDIIQKYDINTKNLSDVANPVADKNVAFEDMPTGKYDVTHVQELYDMLYDKGIASSRAALEVGCMVEVTDVDDLDKYIEQAEASNATDIVDGFNILRDGSYNHYWAFDKALKNMGVAEGCGAAGAEYAKTTDDYPNNNH